VAQTLLFSGSTGIKRSWFEVVIRENEGLRGLSNLQANAAEALTPPKKTRCSNFAKLPSSYLILQLPSSYTPFLTSMLMPATVAESAPVWAPDFCRRTCSTWHLCSCRHARFFYQSSLVPGSTPAVTLDSPVTEHARACRRG